LGEGEAALSTRAFQNVLLQMKEVTSKVIGVIDTEGVIVASSEFSAVGKKLDISVGALENPTASVIVVNRKTFKPLASLTSKFEYAIFVDGDDEASRIVCLAAAVALNEAKLYFEGKHNAELLSKI
jgi:carbohydrate diacid regulator